MDQQLAHAAEPATEAAAAATISAHASKATYGGAGVTIFGGFALNDVAIVVGMLVGVIGLVIQWHYKRKAVMAEIEFHRAEDQRRQEEHEARMQELLR